MSKITSGKWVNVLISSAFIMFIGWIIYKYSGDIKNNSLLNPQDINLSNQTEIQHFPGEEMLPGAVVDNLEDNTNQCDLNNKNAKELMVNGFNKKALKLLNPNCESYSEVYSQLITKINSEKSKVMEVEAALSNQDIDAARIAFNELKINYKDSDYSNIESVLIGLEQIFKKANSTKIIFPAIRDCGNESKESDSCAWDFIKYGNPIRDTSIPDSNFEGHPCRSDGAIRLDRLNSAIIVSNNCMARFITDQSDASKIYYKRTTCGGFLNKKCSWNYQANGEPAYLRSLNGKCDDSSYIYDRDSSLIIINDKCKAEFETKRVN